MFSMQDWQSNISKYAEGCEPLSSSLIFCAAAKKLDSRAAAVRELNENGDDCEMQTKTTDFKYLRRFAPSFRTDFRY